MATQPNFTNTVNCNAGIVPATLDTSYTAPTNTTTVFTAGSSGSKVEEIRFNALGTTVQGIVNVFRHDGSVYHLIDQVQVPVVTASTTAAAWSYVKLYSNLILKSGDTLRVSNTIAGNQSLIKVSVFGGDY